ncbi:MAG: ABC transporter permease [Steroidobacteraceae bacterium]
MTVLVAERWEPLSQSLRRLRRDWAFTAAFVLTLTLGIAANLAVFSALDAYFLSPLPYPNDRNLIEISFTALKYPIPPGAMSAPAYQGLRSARALFASGLAKGWGNRTVAVPGEPLANDPAAIVTASTFATLDVQPLLGRWISPAADRAGGPAEVDVSYQLWQSAFHGDPRVLGRTLRISDELYTVVGVMPPGFAFPDRHVQLWVPIVLTPAMLGPQSLTNRKFVQSVDGVSLRFQQHGVDGGERFLSTG